MASGRGRGKVILLGEHAVVYGRPALGAALATGASASAAPAAAWTLVLADTEIRVRAGTPESELARAFAALLKATGTTDGSPQEVSLGFEIATGAGLGASAAAGVAVAQAVSEACGNPLGASGLAAAALAWERIFHGNPSGIDTTLAAHGGCGVFRRAEPFDPVIPARTIALVVANTGEPASTARMVESVAGRLEADAVGVNRIFDEIGVLVLDGRRCLERGDFANLGLAMDRNHDLLSLLGVSTPRLDDLCARARAAGALGAKLTGSGGGGCMIALAEDEACAAKIRQVLARDDPAAFVARLGGAP